MDTVDLTFLRSFFRAVTDRPIEFNGVDDSRYVPIYEDPAFAAHDPVKLLARPIQFALGQSVQLLSGFRGSGKSTELHRLRKYLSQSGDYKVVLCDLGDYLNLSQSVGIVEFLLAIAGAFGDALQKEGFLPLEPSKEGYWERFTQFLLRTSSSTPDLFPVDLKVALRSEPSFRETLHKRMSGQLGALVEDIRAYVTGCVKKVKERYGPDTEVVLLLDSVEHIRGTSFNATPVFDSVVDLFTTHSEKLHFDHLHVVYTTPLYLKVLHPNIGTLYAPGGVQVLPTLKVRERESRRPFQPGLDALARFIAGRGDWTRLLGSAERETLDELLLLSGGDMRSLLRLFANIIRFAQQVPVPRSAVEAAIQQLRSEFLPVADEDALGLERIASSLDVALQSQDRIHDLMRYFNTGLVLGYRNGEEWYDIHPLVRDVLRQQAVRALNAAVPLQPEDSHPQKALADEIKLTALRIGSFRLLRQAELRLEPPFAVIVGPNQSGKSSLLDALQLLADAARGNLTEALVQRRGGFSSILSRGATDPTIHLEVELRVSSGQLLRYQLRLGPVGSYDFAVVLEELAEYSQERWVPILSRSGVNAKLLGVSISAPNGRECLLSQLSSVSHPLVHRVQGALASIAVYPYFRTGAMWADPEAVPMRRPARLEAGSRLQTTGGNLAAALYSMREERSDDWQDFLRIVRRAFPQLKELRLPAVSRGTVQLLWENKGGGSFDASELSDGTLGFLATLCALFEPGSALIAVDEPEAHLHPDALIRLAGAARSLSERQPIIFTTQSDTLIGLLDETPESIVVAQREEECSQLVRPKPEELREWLKGFSLRDMRRELEEWSPAS